MKNESKYMPKTILDLDDEEDKTVNIVKVHKSFEDKRDAIKFIIKEYKKRLLKDLIKSSSV